MEYFLYEMRKPAAEWIQIVLDLDDKYKKMIMHWISFKNICPLFFITYVDLSINWGYLSKQIIHPLFKIHIQ